VSFTKEPRRRPEPPARRFVLPRFFASPFATLAALALAAVVVAAWGLVRHYTTVLPPMHVPVHTPPAPAPTYDADAGEMPVPDFATWDGG
jgi:hypothetical protein